jgi:hypothetical protein
LTKSKILNKKSISNKIALWKGEHMAKVKKVRCSAKTKEGKRCKNTATGIQKLCCSQKKIKYKN